MPYTHYGEIGDLWKHLPLCSFLSIEKVIKYIESNAAFPKYQLDHTPAREYGIFTLLTKSKMVEFKELKDTPFINTLLSIQENNHDLTYYLGSPGLSMKLLGNKASYIFCDIENQPLKELVQFAALNSIRSVETKEGDSIDNLWLLVEGENGSDSFFHIDPYRIFEKNKAGRSYFDLFVKSVKIGIKTMLWYGYETKQQQQKIYNEMVSIFKDKSVDVQEHRVNGIEIEIESIGENKMTVNPGVPGCGVMIANMSNSSIEALQQTSEMLVKAYEDAEYLGLSGRLNKRVTFKN